jgi:hypothetical protein
MFPEPSAVWVERSRRGLSRPSRYSYSEVAALRIPPLPSSHALVSRVRRHPTARVELAPALAGTSKSCGQHVRQCRHQRSDISRYDISDIRGSAAHIHRGPFGLKRWGASTTPRAAARPSRIPEDARRRRTSALDHQTALATAETDPVTAADRATNPPCRCRHRHHATLPAHRKAACVTGHPVIPMSPPGLQTARRRC